MWFSLYGLYNSKTNDFCYTVGGTIKELWAKVIEEETFGTGYTRKMLNKQGWKAKKIIVRVFL